MLNNYLYDFLSHIIHKDNAINLNFITFSFLVFKILLSCFLVRKLSYFIRAFAGRKVQLFTFRLEYA